MIAYVIIDKNGWVAETVVTDFIDPQSYEGKTIVEVNKSELAHINMLQPILFWDSDGFHQVRDKGRIWKRLRESGLRGRGCANAFRGIIDIDHYPNIPNENIVNEPTVIPKSFAPNFVGEIKPFLRLDLANENDIDLWSKSMVASGLYSEDEAFIEAATWLSDHMTWCVKVTWKDKVIQIDTLTFQSDGKTVQSGYNAHFERRLPSWLWKQITKLIYQELYKHGIETVIGFVRKDKRNWIETIKKRYGSEELGESGAYVRMRNNLKDFLSKSEEWPTRKTVQGWKHEENNFTIREATEDDYPAIKSLANDIWGDRPRKELALRVIEEDWELCNGTLLIAITEDKIVGCLMIREKEPGVSLINLPLRRPNYASDLQKIFHRPELTWQKEVGYKRTTIWIETRFANQLLPFFEAYGLKVESQNDEVTIFGANIDDLLAVELDSIKV